MNLTKNKLSKFAECLFNIVNFLIVNDYQYLI